MSTGGEEILVAIFVDDIIVAYSSERVLKTTKEILIQAFEIRDMGPLKFCLGIDFNQKNGVISMGQKGYIQKLLKRFDMENCKQISTPMEIRPKLIKAENKEESNVPYQNLIGALMYLAVATRPDIMYSVSYLSQFNTCYDNTHWKAAKRILRYLKGTDDFQLTYRKTGRPMKGYADADWASCTIDRRSYTGYCFHFGGALVSWEARKQRTVALSTCEAELMAITEAFKESTHLSKLINDLKLQNGVLEIYNDNQAAQSSLKNPVVSSKTKHIDIKESYVKEALERGSVKLSYMRTEEMIADMMTKALPEPALKKLRTSAGLVRGSIGSI